MSGQSSRSSRVAAVLFIVNGLYWTIAAPYYAVRIRRLGRLPVSGRIELFSGPIHTRFGPQAVTWTLVPFGMLGLLEVLAGYWLAKSRREGELLALWLLPVSLVFWIGLGLPIWFLGGPLRVALVVVRTDDTTNPADRT